MGVSVEANFRNHTLLHGDGRRLKYRELVA